MNKQRTGFTAWFFDADAGDAPYIAKLRDWMDKAPSELPFSRKFKWVLRGLIDTVNGTPLTVGEAAVNVDAVAALVRDQLRGEMLDWLRELVGDGQRVQAINALHELGDVNDAMLQNVLDDWDNGGES